MKPDTLVWQAGMAEWQTADTIRPEWFNRTANEPPVSGSEELTGDMTVLVDRLLKSHRWIQFLSIAGMILGAVLVGATLILFFLGPAISGKFGPATLMSIAFSLSQLLTTSICFVCALLLFKYSTRLSVLKSNGQSSNLIAAIDAANRFWKLTGIALLLALVAIPMLMLIVTAIGWLMPAPPEVPFDPFE